MPLAFLYMSVQEWRCSLVRVRKGFSKSLSKKMRAKWGKVSRVDGHRGSEWLCIEKRLWLGSVFSFGLFGWVLGIQSTGFTFVNCIMCVTTIITII